MHFGHQKISPQTFDAKSRLFPSLSRLNLQFYFVCINQFQVVVVVVVVVAVVAVVVVSNVVDMITETNDLVILLYLCLILNLSKGFECGKAFIKLTFQSSFKIRF